MGIGAYLTTVYMETGINREAAGYYKDRAFKDFEMISSLGASDANIQAIANTPGIVDAEGVLRFDGSLRSGDQKRNITAISLTERVSVPVLADGRLPSAEDECAIGEDFSEISGIGIGDEAVIYLSDTGSGDPLVTHSFTITGLIKHPDYVHRKLTDTVVMPISAFTRDEGDRIYTQVFVKAENVPDDDAFLDTYYDSLSDEKSSLEDLCTELADARSAEVKKEALRKIDEEWAKAQAELADAQAEIDSGDRQLKSKLASGRRKLVNSKKKLNKELASAGKKLADGEITIADYEKKLADGKAEYEKGSKEVDEAQAKLDKDRADVGPYLEQAGPYLEILKYLIEHRSEKDTSKYIDYEKQAAQEIKDNSFALYMLSLQAKDPETRKAAQELDKERGVDIFEKALDEWLAATKEYSVDSLIAEAKAIVGGTQVHFSDDAFTLFQPMYDISQNFLTILDEAARTIEDARAELAKAAQEISDGEKQLADAKDQLAKGKKELKKNKTKYNRQIANGWKQYYKNKNKYEQQIADARTLLAENREEAERKIEEARADVRDLKCTWVVLDRRANSGYLDLKGQLKSIRAAGYMFGALFIIITMLVCLSTLTIMIEDQKKQIGTSKAFGFYKNEVLRKYLIFGVTAAVLGDILSGITGTVIGKIVLYIYNNTNIYQFNNIQGGLRPVPYIAVSLVMIAVCIIATILACLEILRSPASALMQGLTKAGGFRKGKTSGRSRKGSLYIKLIFRNMTDDKARVAISIIIVAACTILIGVGVTFKYAFSGMITRQTEDVLMYDLRLDTGSTVTDEERAKLADVIGQSGAESAEALFESHMFSADGVVSGVDILAADPARISAFIGINYLGEHIVAPDDGLIIPRSMAETYGYGPGSTMEVYDNSMEAEECTVKGYYTNYFGRLTITSAKGYKKIFGDEYKPNCFYIDLNGADEQKLRQELLAVSEDISFSPADEFKSSIASVSQLYDIITYVTTGIAIVMSFMILTNLANILVMRKKNELTVMRVNGFSVGQTTYYLSLQAAISTIAGLAIGALIGSLVASKAVMLLEPADLQFDRDYHAAAWFIAVGLEGLFAIIIYSNSFRRIKDFSLRDIA